jgi:hypothetical protein
MKNKKPSMTRQHFEAVANIIASHNNINTNQKRSIVNSFIKYFKTQNKNFDSFKFYNKSMVNNYNGLSEINPDTTEMENLLNEDYNETMKGGN